MQKQTNKQTNKQTMFTLREFIAVSVTSTFGFVYYAQRHVVPKLIQLPPKSQDSEVVASQTVARRRTADCTAALVR